MLSRAGEIKATRLTRFLNEFFGGRRCTAALTVDEATDLSALRVAQLRQLLDARRAGCADCVEKADFVRRVREVYSRPYEPCEDAHKNCARWAESGECERNKPYMEGSCRRSCGWCAETA